MQENDYIIIPYNFDIPVKLLGIINYKNLIVCFIISAITGFVLTLIPIAFIAKAYIFIVLTFPIFLFAMNSTSEESIIDIVKYMIKFVLKRRVYIFMR